MSPYKFAGKSYPNQCVIRILFKHRYQALTTKLQNRMCMLHIRLQNFEWEKFIMQNAVSTIQIEIAHCLIEFLPNYCSIMQSVSSFDVYDEKVP